MRQKSSKQSGQGIIEVLIASLLIAVSAVGLGYSILKMGKSKKRLEAISQAVSIESGIVAKLSDPATFAALSTNMRAGIAGSLPSINISVPAKVGGAQSNISVATETRQFFRIDGTACTGFTDKECLYSILVKGQNLNIAGARIPGYAYGYRIEVNPAFANVAPFGAKIVSGDSGNIPADQLQVSVPFDAYRDTNLKSCDPAKDVLITGMNKETGQLFCLKRPDPVATSCDPAAGMLMKGLKVVFQPSVGYVIQPDCMQMRKVECTDTRYSLQSVVPTDFIAANPISASTTCVYKTADSETYTFVTSANAREWKGTLCPPDYEYSSVTCTASLIDSKQGQYDACSAGYHGDIRYCSGPSGVNTVISTPNANKKDYECKLDAAAILGSCPSRPVTDSWWDSQLTISGTCKLKAGLKNMAATSKSY